MLRVSLKNFQQIAKGVRFAGQIPTYSFAQARKTNEGYVKTPLEPEQEKILRDTAIPKGPKVEEVLAKDASLNSFMVKIYSRTGLSVAASLGLSHFIAKSSLVFYHPFALMFGGLGLSIGGIVFFNMIAPIIKRDYVAGTLVEKWENPLTRKLAFASIIAGSGMAIAPLLASIANPGIIPLAIGLSFGVMGGSTLYALKKPLGHFKTWESTLVGALFGLVGINIVSLLTTAIIGPNVFSYTARGFDLWVGLGLFSAFQAYDTHTAIEAFRHGNYDHLQHVIQFFLNFKNLFIRIVQLLTRDRD